MGLGNVRLKDAVRASCDAKATVLVACNCRDRNGCPAAATATVTARRVAVTLWGTRMTVRRRTLVMHGGSRVAADAQPDHRVPVLKAAARSHLAANATASPAPLRVEEGGGRHRTRTPSPRRACGVRAELGTSKTLSWDQSKQPGRGHAGRPCTCCP